MFSRNPRAFFLAIMTFLMARPGIPYERGHSDPSRPGPYAVGHELYTFVDREAGDRPVVVSVWYPADPSEINANTPPAQYPLDPLLNYLPVTNSTDWEKEGSDPAYASLSPSPGKPFPLIIFSPGWMMEFHEYIFIATRVASHGYVVAVLEHATDGQWGWIEVDPAIVTGYNRTRDMSFALTQLLAKNDTRGDLMYRTIDPRQIAAAGHSLGGYATLAMAAGDDSVCDAGPAAAAYFGDVLPEPDYTCVPFPADRRIKAIITLDGTSDLLRYKELGRVRVPSLLMGESAEALAANLQPELGTFIARPHAAIDRDDSFRVDVDNANHMAFSNICPTWDVMAAYGLISAEDLPLYRAWTGCDVVLPATTMNQVITKYVIAFANTFLRHDPRDAFVLTAHYALTHQPTVQFINDEECGAGRPDRLSFRYRTHQTADECLAAPKDPTGWFEP